MRKIWETLFRLPLPLQRESSLFLIVNVLDVLMTCLLLEDLTGVTGETIFYESNPVARYFLVNWGTLAGIVYFKSRDSLVGVVEVIARISKAHEKHPGGPAAAGVRHPHRVGRGDLQHRVACCVTASLEPNDRNRACFPAEDWSVD